MEVRECELHLAGTKVLSSHAVVALVLTRRDASAKGT